MTDRKAPDAAAQDATDELLCDARRLLDASMEAATPASPGHSVGLAATADAAVDVAAMTNEQFRDWTGEVIATFDPPNPLAPTGDTRDDTTGSTLLPHGALLMQPMDAEDYPRENVEDQLAHTAALRAEMRAQGLQLGAPDANGEHPDTTLSTMATLLQAAADVAETQLTTDDAYPPLATTATRPLDDPHIRDRDILAAQAMEADPNTDVVSVSGISDMLSTGDKLTLTQADITALLADA